MSENTTLKDLGERAVIELIREWCGSSSALRGIGDDTAVVSGPQPGMEILLTSDPVIEHIHFDQTVRPSQVGHKAVGRVLSDVAAMGGDPKWILLNVSVSGSMAVHDLKDLYQGATELAKAFDVKIVGGDLAQSDVLSVHAFAVGQVANGKAALRSTAKVGDQIYVTGQLGGSIHGRHLTFCPRVREGQWLCEQGWVTSMMDVSDGVGSDLWQILKESGVQAELVLNQIPVSDDVSRHSDGLSPVEHALFDGEDFELLFTVAADKVERFEEAWAQAWSIPCSRIGGILRGAPALNARCPDGNKLELGASGYDHFMS